MKDDKTNDANKDVKADADEQALQRGEVSKEDMQQLQDEHHNEQSPEQHKPRRFLGFIVFVTFVVAVVALVLVIVVWSGELPVKTPANPQVQTNQQALELLKTDVDGLSQKVNSTDSSMKAQQQAIASAQTAVERVLAEVDQNQDLWQLQDAAHLLQVASYTLNFSRNIPTTIAILETADSRLRGLADPQIYPIRQTIAEEIATLQAVSKVDIPGVYMRLQALSQQVPSLPVVENRFQHNANDNYLKQKDPTEQGSFWHGVWHALSQVVVIRRHDKPIQPILPYADHKILVQNIYLLFLQAQWGLLHQQQTIYNNSLQQIVKVLKTYFVDNNEQVQKVITAVTALESVNVNPTLPDIGQALRQTQTLLKTRNQELLTGMAAKDNASKKVTTVNNNGNTKATATKAVAIPSADSTTAQGES